MDELRESSLLFSLEGLLETERDRVRREAREAEQRQAEELKRVAELAERRRVAAEEARQARARRLALEAERDRLEQERIEAMKRATVERARLETEGQMRLLELEQQRKHEIELVRLREAQGLQRYRTLSRVFASGAVFVTGASLLVIFGWLQPARASERQHLQGLLEQSLAQKAASERLLSAELRKNQELRDQQPLATSCTPAPEPKPAEPTHVTGPRGPHGSGPKPPVNGPRYVDDGDPLNTQLPPTRRR